MMCATSLSLGVTGLTRDLTGCGAAERRLFHLFIRLAKDVLLHHTLVSLHFPSLPPSGDHCIFHGDP